MTEKIYWNEKMETISAEALKQLETEGLKKQLDYVYRNSLFYRKKFDDAGVSPGNFKAHEDLARFPYTTKDELRKSQEEYGGLGGHQCAPIDKIVRIQGTSGTTGRPLFIGLTSNDADQWRELYARHGWTGGLRPDDVMINPANFSLFVGGLSECAGAEHMGITVIPAPIGTTGMEKLMMLIKELKPTILMSTPSMCEYLEQKVREILKVEPIDLGMKKGFLAGEALSEEERERIQSIWGIDARNFYGLADVAADISSECGQSRGLHFCGQGFLVAEIIDPETLDPLPWEEGVEGEIVFTTIYREATPVIRYRVRDMVRVYMAPCSCGRTGFRFHVIGRSDDMIKVKGVNVFPAAVRGLVQKFAPRTTGEMRLVLPHPGPSFGENITLKVEYDDEFPIEELKGLGEELKQSVREKLQFTPVVELVKKNTLERSQYKVEYFEKAYEE